MRIPGYCTSCRRITTVKVSGGFNPARNVQYGICMACETKREKKS